MNKSLSYIFAICLTLVISNLSFKVALATSATPSASPTSAEEIEQSLQDRIKKAIQDNLPAVQQTLDAQTAVSSYKAFVGTIETISGKTITIKTNSGVKQAIIDEDTAIVNQGKTGAKIADLPLNHSIIAIGLTSDMQTQTSTRVIVYSTPTSTPREVQIVTFGKLTTSNRTVVIDDEPYKLSTRLQIYNSALVKQDLSDLDTGQSAIIVFHQLDDGPVITRIILQQTTGSSSTTQSICGDTVCAPPESPETCPKDCQS